MSEIDEDLEWFWNCSDSELGLRSSWDAMVQLAMSGGGKKQPDQCADPMSEQRIESAWRQRAIMSSLSRVPAQQVKVLKLVFEDRNWPPELVAKFGRLTGICAMTETALKLSTLDAGKEPVTTDVLRWVAGAIHRDDDDAVAAIKAESEAILEAAKSAYAKSASNTSSLHNRRPSKNHRVTSRPN